MKLIQLRYLVAVAENDLNITQAARVLHAAQPGVSKQLKQLEDELGFQLFERKGRALVRPTDAGTKVIDRASQIVRQARSIKALASELRKDEAGSLSIATTHTQARYVLPQVLKRFRDKYPKVRLHLHQGNSEQIADLATTDRIDLAIATGASPMFSGLVRLPCFRWHRAIVVPDGHPLGEISKPTMAELAQYPLVTYSFSFSGPASLVELFAEEGLTPNVALTAWDSDVIKKYVREGLASASSRTSRSTARKTRISRCATPRTCSPCTPRGSGSGAACCCAATSTTSCRCWRRISPSARCRPPRMRTRRKKWIANSRR